MQKGLWLVRLPQKDGVFVLRGRQASRACVVDKVQVPDAFMNQTVCTGRIGLHRCVWLHRIGQAVAEMRIQRQQKRTARKADIGGAVDDAILPFQGHGESEVDGGFPLWQGKG